MLNEDDRFLGNKAAFCAAMATRTISEYNKFGTVEGVLYHELLHVMLAKSFAEQLQNERSSNCRAAVMKPVKRRWPLSSMSSTRFGKEWRGLLLHDADFGDERFVWEKECAYYIKQYERRENRNSL